MKHRYRVLTNDGMYKIQYSTFMFWVDVKRSDIRRHHMVLDGLDNIPIVPNADLVAWLPGQRLDAFYQFREYLATVYPVGFEPLLFDTIFTANLYISCLKYAEICGNKNKWKVVNNYCW